LEVQAFDLLVTDLKMDHLDGLELLDQAKRLDPELGVILITAYADLDGAVEATKRGAFHYLAKPFNPDQLRRLVDQALAERAQRDQASQVDSERLLIGDSPQMRRVDELLGQVAPAECNILLVGESGTGKELAARLLHARSRRSRGPFVAFNCAAFSPELVAHELFGHEKEAFTGAASPKKGLLEAAHQGTVFLDEIGEMDPSAQVKLLRVIQEREVLRLGGTRPQSLDLRFVSATARDLKAAVAEGRFRQDLYFRLNVVAVTLPPLRERQADVVLLAHHFLARFRQRQGRDVQGFAPEALALLSRYHYPGNVRELENIVERAVAVCRGRTILVRDLPPDLAEVELRTFPATAQAAPTLEEVEADYIRHVLKLTGGARARAARILGIDRASLWRKIKKYDLD
jgi:DNA-binding NtrC family response regulator